MKSHHLTERRPPKKNGGFSWSRFPLGDTATVTYRLFRRDMRGALHMADRVFRDRARTDIAHELRRTRHKLRDRVDETDLALMGVTP